MNLPRNEEILINVTPQETRVAIVENGMLQELHIERIDAKGMVGNIYKGKVVRVLPGMQAAFVEIGLERTAFLHARDAKPMLIMGDSENDQHQSNQDSPEGSNEKPINELVREGQEILVQVVKDPMGSKGARLTTEISIPSRYLVYLPHSQIVGISQRITDESTREVLRSIIDTIKQQNDCPGGYIARTSAETTQAGELQQDMMVLCRLWAKASAKEKNSRAPALIYEDLPLALRALRDFVRDSVSKVLIDSTETYDKVHALAKDLTPDSIHIIEHYRGERPIFDLYSVEDEIERALQRSVPLKSGGHLVIDQTEAMTTIDVNTGSFVGKKNLEETVFKTNLEAARAVARQLRLRNLGGIIIIDFIDMQVKSHQNQVLGALERGLARDSTKNNMTEMSTLGLVEITRKRTRESLGHQLMEDCSVCDGRGTLKTAHTICNEIFREILREARQYEEASAYMVIASQDVIDRLLDEESANLADLQEFIGAPIQLQVEATYFQENYDIVLT
jgi:ribonuclease G